MEKIRCILKILKGNYTVLTLNGPGLIIYSDMEPEKLKQAAKLFIEKAYKFY